MVVQLINPLGKVSIIIFFRCLDLLSGLAGWGKQRAKIQPPKKLFKKKYKDDQNGLIYPETWRL